jgi:hypothetical protein
MEIKKIELALQSVLTNVLDSNLDEKSKVFIQLALLDLDPVIIYGFLEEYEHIAPLNGSVGSSTTPMKRIE